MQATGIIDSLEMAPWAARVLIGAASGAIAGSYIATLVSRWPRDLTTGGRSRCDSCDRRLGILQLVPILSFVMLRGRCRRCGAAIDPQHLWIELAAAVIGLIALAGAPALEGFAGAIFGWLLLALFVLDLAHFWLPDRLTIAVAVSGLATGLVGIEPPLAERLIGGAAGFAALATISAGYRYLRGRDGMGGGDPKLLGAIGLWLGWRVLPFVLLLAAVLGLACILCLRLAGRRFDAATPVPFGAALALAAWSVWLGVAAG